MRHALNLAGGLLGAAVALLFLALIAGQVIRAQHRAGCAWERGQAWESLTCRDGQRGGIVAPGEQFYEGFQVVYVAIMPDGEYSRWGSEREAQQALEGECK